MQKNFSLILADTKRSKYYFKAIIEKKLMIDTIILYSNSKDSPFLKKLKTYPFIKKLIFFKSHKLEIKNIIKKIISIKSKFIVYSGHNAEILKNSLILRKNLIHCHPGLLPNYRGSTTIYYSLLNQQTIFTTIFKMTKKLDSGKIFHTKKHSPPKNLKKIESDFDHMIRAKSIAEFLSKERIFKLNNQAKSNQLYYIAHPVIRDIVVNTKKYIKDYNFKI